MEIAKILTKYVVSDIKDLILEYAYKCECVGHPSTPHYCVYCINLQINDKLFSNPDPFIYRSLVTSCSTTFICCRIINRQYFI